MRNYNNVLFLIFIFIIMIVSFNTCFAKAVYPDPRSLQPMPKDVFSGSNQNMNSDKTQVINSVINTSNETLDYQKLQTLAKQDDAVFLNENNIINYLIYIIIGFLFSFLLIVILLRFS